MGHTVGIVLAAGAGRRYGQPKGGVVTEGVSWAQRSADVLRHGGCAAVIVVLGAGAEDIGATLTDVATVIADDWEEGMSRSLAAGLETLALRDADACVVTLVDLPDVTADVVRRLLDSGASRTTLARATYSGRPGHPVVIGADHVAPLLARLTGDEGARAYLAEVGATPIECGDLASGADIDVPA